MHRTLSRAFSLFLLTILSASAHYTNLAGKVQNVSRFSQLRVKTKLNRNLPKIFAIIIALEARVAQLVRALDS